MLVAVLIGYDFNFLGIAAIVNIDFVGTEKYNAIFILFRKNPFDVKLAFDLDDDNRIDLVQRFFRT